MAIQERRQEPWTVTVEDARFTHNAATCPHSDDPIRHFVEEIRLLRERIITEMALDPEGTEMIAILEEHPSCVTRNIYFKWLTGVLAFQLAYLFVLEHENDQAK